MLVDGVGELKTIHSRHAYVGEDDGNIIFQEQFECFAAGLSGNKIFAQFGEYGFVGEQLGGLIVYHEHVYFFLGAHRSSPICGGGVTRIRLRTCRSERWASSAFKTFLFVPVCDQSQSRNGEQH